MITKETIAALVYDSFVDQPTVGVRRGYLPARQALYRTDKIQLDLKIERTDESDVIAGQIVGEKGNLHLKGIEVQLIRGGKIVGKSSTNALGEFIFQNLSEGRYEVQVVLSDTVIKLPGLPELRPKE